MAGDENTTEMEQRLFGCLVDVPPWSIIYGHLHEEKVRLATTQSADIRAIMLSVRYLTAAVMNIAPERWENRDKTGEWLALEVLAERISPANAEGIIREQAATLNSQNPQYKDLYETRLVEVIKLIGG